MMKRQFAKSLLLISLATVAITSPAQALDFNFSFNSTFVIPGTIEGTIFGLADNTNGQTASAIVINTATLPAAYSPPLPEGDTATTWTIQDFHSFDVSGGMITDATFRSLSANGTGQVTFTLNLGGANLFGQDLNSDGVVNLFELAGNLDGLAGVTFTPVPFEFEASLGLIVLGIMASGYAFNKKRKANKKLVG